MFNSLPSSLFLALTLRAHIQGPRGNFGKYPSFSTVKNNKMINPLSNIKKNKNQTKNKHFKTALTRAQNINFTKTDKFRISKKCFDTVSSHCSF